MQAKNVICFDIEKEGRTYRLQMPHGAPLGEAYEVVSCFQAEMVRLINEHAEKSKPENEETEKQEKSQKEE